MFIERIEPYTLWGKNVYYVFFNDGSFVIGNYTESQPRADHHADGSFSVADGKDTFETKFFNIIGASTFYYLITRFYAIYGEDALEIEGALMGNNDLAYRIIRAIFDDYVSAEWHKYWKTEQSGGATGDDI